MRKELYAGSMILLLLLSSASNLATAGGEIKEVCHKELKNNKQVDVCKKIKVHKKLEGTQFPSKPVKK